MALQLYRLRYVVDVDDEIDGILAIDQETLRLVVEALGPLTVLEYPEPLMGDNVIQAVRQSWAPAEGQGLTAEWRAHHKDFIGRLLTVAVNELRAGQVDLVALGGAVLQALEERHLFVYVPGEGPVSEALHRAGWDGALHEGPGDYLMLVDANLGFNKVNPYVTERVSYTVDLRDPSRPRADLTVVHRHEGPDTGAPCRHESRYDLTYEQMMARCYWDYVRARALTLYRWVTLNSRHNGDQWDEKLACSMASEKDVIVRWLTRIASCESKLPGFVTSARAISLIDYHRQISVAGIVVPSGR